jgi:hypothetical protein
MTSFSIGIKLSNWLVSITHAVFSLSTSLWSLEIGKMIRFGVGARSTASSMRLDAVSRACLILGGCLAFNRISYINNALAFSLHFWCRLEHPFGGGMVSTGLPNR